MTNLKTENILSKINAQALLLFSGGLDSILAAKILKEQGIQVTALALESHFFDAEQAKKSARENNIDLIVCDISKPHLDIVKNPIFGRGAGMNPCIDCHLLMLKMAKKIAKKGKFGIVATGEVLGQRPMSQNIRALALIEKKAGLEKKILRPLSAKMLPETEMEKGGIVNRKKLLGISGRGRKDQIRLAKKYKIKNFPSPAGGCILTDRGYSQKLRELLSNKKYIRSSDLELLKIGRNFWTGKTRIVLGRNHQENIALQKMAEKGDILIEPEGFSGPTALIRGQKIEASIEASIESSKEKIIGYSKKSGEKPLAFKIFRKKRGIAVLQSLKLRKNHPCRSLLFHR